MSLQIRPGYTNPLTAMTHTKQIHPSLGKHDSVDKTAELQTKQQPLQNTLLLIKSTGTDGGASSVEQQKTLQAELEEVSKELQSAKNDVSLNSSATKLRMDTYEKRVEELSSGIYQVQREKNSNYHISFLPYKE